MKRKVVYNSCYGGFGLSIEALIRYYKYKYPGKNLFFYRSTSDTDKESITMKEAIAEDFRYPHFRVDFLDKDFGSKVSEDDLDDYHKHIVNRKSQNIERHDPILVRVVEELGPETASGRCAKLAIADIGESLYRIEEYHGLEKVVTPETQQFKWL